jgi:hypothetical protein
MIAWMDIGYSVISPFIKEPILQFGKDRVCDCLILK